jgi:hypothetical protein
MNRLFFPCRKKIRMACHIEPANTARSIIASVGAPLQHVGKVSLISDTVASESRWAHHSAHYTRCDLSPRLSVFDHSLIMDV